MDVKVYRVARSFLFRKGLRCGAGTVLSLDATDPVVRRAAGRGLLVETDEEPTGGLQRLDGRPVDEAAPEEHEPQEPETITEVEAQAATLLEDTVDGIASATREAVLEVLIKAEELEANQPKPRKGALEAIRAELEARGV